MKHLYKLWRIVFSCLYIFLCLRDEISMWVRDKMSSYHRKPTSLPDRFFGLRARASLGWRGGDVVRHIQRGKERGTGERGEDEHERGGERGVGIF